MTETNYTTRCMRRRRGTDKWEVTLSHTNPITGETVRPYHSMRSKRRLGSSRASPRKSIVSSRLSSSVTR